MTSCSLHLPTPTRSSHLHLRTSCKLWTPPWTSTTSTVTLSVPSHSPREQRWTQQALTSQQRGVPSITCVKVTRSRRRACYTRSTLWQTCDCLQCSRQS